MTKRYGNKRVPDCECESNFTCGACLRAAPSYHYSGGNYMFHNLDSNLQDELERDSIRAAQDLAPGRGYSGGVNDGSGVQGHSRGGLYHWVCEVTGTAKYGDVRYIHPDGRKTAPVRYGMFFGPCGEVCVRSLVDAQLMAERRLREMLA